MAVALATRSAATTIDAFLGGRVAVVQPADGHHRSGLEAVLLAAAVDTALTGTILDLGAGAGAAGLAAAARCQRARVVLVERDPTALACARAALSLAANRAFARRVSVVAADIAAPEAVRAAAGLHRASADVVITNPPFHAVGRGSASPQPARAEAHVLGDGGLDAWLRVAASLLKPRGRLVVVFRADGLDAVLAACRGRFGSLDVLPIQPRAGEPAHRIVLRAVKASRGPLRLLPPLALHRSADGAYLPAAEAVLRLGRGLHEAHAVWGERGPGA